jgi:hypothetical protein
MKPKLKKWLIRCAAVCVLFFLGGYCLRDFWIGQIRIYLLGLMEVRADEFGYKLPEVDEIEVMALGSRDFSMPDGPDRVAHYAIFGRTVLHGEEAENVAKLWRHLLRGRGFSAMCHEPAYALRFRQHGKLLFETTICWACHNYTIPVGNLGRFEYGFDSKREDAQSLLKLLESHVPLPGKPST